MTKGTLFWFCAEWQRYRRTICPDNPDAFFELKAALNKKGELSSDNWYVQQHGLDGWCCDPEEAADMGLLPKDDPRQPRQTDPPIVEQQVEAGAGAGPQATRPKKPVMPLVPGIGSPPGYGGQGPFSLSLGLGSLLRAVSPTTTRPMTPNEGPEGSSLPRIASRSPTPVPRPPSRPASRAGNEPRSEHPRPPSRSGLESSRPRSRTAAVVSERPNVHNCATSSRAQTPNQRRKSLPVEVEMGRSPSPHFAIKLPGRSAQILFWDPLHPLSGLPDPVSKGEFADEIRKRMKMLPLFKQIAAEPILSVDEAERLWEALMIIQESTGIALSTGPALDACVEKFFLLGQLRMLIERTSPTTKAFFAELDVNGDSQIEPEELKLFFKNLAASSDRTPGLVGFGQYLIQMGNIFFAIFDSDKNTNIDFVEFRQQLSMSLHASTSIVEIANHFELKYGYGKSGLPDTLNCRQLFARLAKHENLDVSPEDAAKLYNLWKCGNEALTARCADVALRTIPCELTWEVTQEHVDRFYCAFGVRALQLARSSKIDSCLPAEAVFGLKGDADLKEACIRDRFDRLWHRHVFLEGTWERKEKLAEELKERCWQRYRGIAQEIIDTCSKWCHGPLEAFPADLHSGPRSLLPNIGDVLAIPSTRLYTGQTFIIRYRLTGAQNFVHPDHKVMHDGRNPLPWPVPADIFGQTPFIGLVPRGLRWTNAGGGGFYLGKEPFAKVDPGLRADLPRCPKSGRLMLYGVLEIEPPSLLRRGPNLTDSALSCDFELRLFCSRRNKIVGSIGDPLHVTVEQRAAFPPSESIQAKVDGRKVILRWTHLDLGPFAPSMLARQVNLYIRSGKNERTMTLDPRQMECEFNDLLPDTEYEFRVRLNSEAGHGREVGATVRTNGRCSEPKNLARIESTTSSVEISFDQPDSIGNEVTRDKFQVAAEEIIRYEATLCVDDVTDDGRPQVQLSNPGDEAGGGNATGRQCQWRLGNLRSGNGRSAILPICGLRPDVRYCLHGCCAVNSMGPGIAARALAFYTLPQAPVICDVRVRAGQSRVIITCLMVAAHRMEFEVTVCCTATPKEVKTFTPEQTAKEHVGEGEPTELYLPFGSMAIAEPTSTHTVGIRARGGGGWSDWGKAFVTNAIARQQCADHVQAKLVESIALRDLSVLARVLKEARGIEFQNEQPLHDATALHDLLHTTQEELVAATSFRDPIRLENAYKSAVNVGLPNLELEISKEILDELMVAKHRLDTAQGIDDLTAALEYALKHHLQGQCLLDAAERLKRRKAAYANLVAAMEQPRTSVLTECLAEIQGMHLPIEKDAVFFLQQLVASEALLRNALGTRLIIDATVALESAQTSNLQEKELIESVKDMKEELGRERAYALAELHVAIQERYPDVLKEKIEAAVNAQVDDEEVSVARDLMHFLCGFLARIDAAVGTEERTLTLEEARCGKVPPSLLEYAEEQLLCLTHCIAAHTQGDVPETRATLKLATVARVKDVELAEIRDMHRKRIELVREVGRSVSLARRARLEKAIGVAVSFGIMAEHLDWAQNVVEALKVREQAENNLREAIESRTCEVLQEALVEASDSDVQQAPLVKRAKTLLETLSNHRAALQVAMDGGELQYLFKTVTHVSQYPGLPFEEILPASLFLDNLCEQEISSWERQLKEVATGFDSRDWRAIDALLVQCTRLADVSCHLEEELLQAARDLSKDMQARDVDRKAEETHLLTMITNKGSLLHDRQLSAFGKADVVGTSTKVPLEHDIVELPFEVVEGAVHLTYRAYGEHRFSLPLEIVHLKISIVAIESPQEGPDYATAAETCDVLLLKLRAMLDSVDTIRRMGDCEELYDGAEHRLEQLVSIYIRAEHEAHDVIEALYEHNTFENAGLGAPKARDYDNPDSANSEAGVICEDSEGASSSMLKTQSLIDNVVPLDPGISKNPHFKHVTAVESEVLSRYMISTTTGAPIDHWPDSSVLRNVRARVLRRVSVDLSWSCSGGLWETLDCAFFVFDDEHLVEVLTCSPGSALKIGRGKGLKLSSVSASIQDVVTITDESDHLARLGKQRVCVRLDLLPAHIRDMVFVVSVPETCDVSRIGDVFVSIVDSEVGVHFTGMAIQDVARGSSIVSCSLSLLGDGLWNVYEISSSLEDCVRNYAPLFKFLQEMGLPRNIGMRNQEPHIIRTIGEALELSHQVKTTEVAIGRFNQLEVKFTVEFIESEAEIGDSVHISSELSNPAIMECVVGALGEVGVARFTADDLYMLPARARQLQRICVDARWDYPLQEVLDSDVMDGRYLDLTMFCFNRSVLQEVVDYRGAHGVRLVHNGVFDELGIWLGVVGTGDATGGHLKCAGGKFDDLQRTGSQSMTASLNKLPTDCTDIFVTLSAPVLGNMSFYSNAKVVIRDAASGYEILAIQLPNRGYENKEAAVLCRISRDYEDYWRLGSFKTGCNGTALDYEPMIKHLRSIQEKKFGRGTSQLFPHRSTRLDQVCTKSAIMTPLQKWSKSAISRFNDVKKHRKKSPKRGNRGSN